MEQAWGAFAFSVSKPFIKACKLAFGGSSRLEHLKHKVTESDKLLPEDTVCDMPSLLVSR